MNCKNCIYCVQSKKEQLTIVCKNKKLLTNLGCNTPGKSYYKIDEPEYCAFYLNKKKNIIIEGE